MREKYTLVLLGGPAHNAEIPVTELPRFVVLSDAGKQHLYLLATHNPDVVNNRYHYGYSDGRVLEMPLSEVIV